MGPVTLATSSESGTRTGKALHGCLLPTYNISTEATQSTTKPRTYRRKLLPKLSEHEIREYFSNQNSGTISHHVLQKPSDHDLQSTMLSRKSYSGIPGQNLQSQLLKRKTHEKPVPDTEMPRASEASASKSALDPVSGSSGRNSMDEDNDMRDSGVPEATEDSDKTGVQDRLTALEQKCSENNGALFDELKSIKALLQHKHETSKPPQPTLSICSENPQELATLRMHNESLAYQNIQLRNKVITLSHDLHYSNVADAALSESERYLKKKMVKYRMERDLARDRIKEFLMTKGLTWMEWQTREQQAGRLVVNDEGDIVLKK